MYGQKYLHRMKTSTKSMSFFAVHVLSREEYLKSPEKINERQKKVRTVRFANSTLTWFMTTAKKNGRSYSQIVYL